MFSFLLKRKSFMSNRKPLCGREFFCGKYKYNSDCCLSCPFSKKSSAAREKADILETGVSAAYAVAPAESKGNICAVDIGTTTVTAVIYDRGGKKIDSVGFLNPQREFGADVIARISAAVQDVKNLARMHRSVIHALDGFIKGKGVGHIVAAGNTVMQHIFANVSPAQIGVAPYLPVFKEQREYNFKDLGFTGEGRVTVLPCISGFIGADIVSGIIACGLEDIKDKIILFLDLGTNGEIVLSAKGKLYACSTAAGPAFEGGNIACGSHAHEKAISKAFIRDGKIAFDRPAGVSICGSALIDFTAALLDLGIIDETGAIDDSKTKTIEIGGEPAIPLNEKVYVSQRDIREMQLAKSAVKAGILTLIDSAGIKETDIDKVYLAGGFGMGLNPVSAEKIYIFPDSLKGKITAVGNTSLAGTVMCALNKDILNGAQALTERINYVELTNNDKFYSYYTNSISFE